MNLEKQVIQARFRNNRHRAVANILYSYNNVVSRMQRMLNEYDLTLQQYNLLRILNRQYPEPVGNCTIREQMFDARSDITRIVDRLIKENLAVRKLCDHDRRKVNITISEKGRLLLDRLEELNDQLDGIVDVLTEEEVDVLNRLLEKVRNHK